MTTLLTCFALTPALFATSVPPEVVSQARALRDAALEDDTAYRYLEALTTEVGPRLAGTEYEKKARTWTMHALQKLGFTSSQISVEPFPMKTWVRGDESARITAPFSQPLVVTALGGSGSTGSQGIHGELIVFESLDDLEDAPKDSLRGKIAFVDHRMNKTQDGSSYSYFGRARFSGPAIAASKGARAMLLRSVGTHNHRLAHTGATRWNGLKPIPAAAVSAPDADLIVRMAKREQPMKISLTLTPRIIGETESANIVIDLKGSERPEEIILAGGHLDSWDLGTGAVDDGAGVAITIAALRLIQERGWKPKRTVRIVHWGAEEVGLFGANAYAERHADEIDQHKLASESDFGAERIYKVNANLSDDGLEVVREMVRVLAPIGVGLGVLGPSFIGGGGPDLSPLHARGLPNFRLAQDGTDYFDLHHTADDTFDKVEDAALRQNVASYAVFLWIAANVDTEFRPQHQERAERPSQ